MRSWSRPRRTQTRLDETQQNLGLLKEAKGSGLFFRSSSRPRCTFEAEPNHIAFDPAIITKRKTSLNAGSQGFDFGIGFGTVHPAPPSSRQGWIVRNV